MKKIFVAIAVIISLFMTNADAWAGVFTAFGPRTFMRGTGKPVTETVSFGIKNPNTAYTLHAYNGGMNSEFSRVSSAIVKINGIVVFGPGDFNQQTSHIQKQVVVSETNVLAVELRSAPGSGLAIMLEGTDDTPPLVTIASPMDGVYLNTPSLTVTGSATDSISSISAVSVNGIAAAYSNNAFSAHIALTEGANTITAQAIDAAGNTAQSAITVILDTIAPELSVTSPLNQTIVNTDTVTTSGTVTDAGSGIRTVSINGATVNISANAFAASSIPLAEGANTITITALDNAGNIAGSTITVYRDTSAPVATITSPSDGSTITSDSVIVTGTVDDLAATVTVNGVSAQAADNTFTATVSLVAGANTITVTVTDPAGNTGTAMVTITFNALVGIPPDPATVAPALDDTVATTIASATAFLYTGDNPIQTGVAPGTIEPKRAAVLRGRVLDREGAGLPGVTITILDHAEYGSTKTRMDGMFDMAVNGGGQLIVKYEREGFIPAQRSADAPWQDYAWLPEIVMIPFDEKVTTVDLSAETPIRAVQGSTVTDEDGTRTATLLFQQGTNALMWLPGGTYETLTTLNVRVTEFTVGENGPKAMPAALPPSSAYTYAVEFSVDEAVAAGATSVSFSRPVISYTDNFLDFPVGTAVPAGYYNRQYGVWVPMDDGRVIKILNIDNGIAALDVDGSGTSASASTLSSLGITDDEGRTLASLYGPDKSLWRVVVNHFSTADYNLPYGLPNGSGSPNMANPKPRGSLPDPCTQGGSIIECENQTLGESILAVGTQYSLNYRSDRTPGRRDAYTLEIPVRNAVPPTSLIRIDLGITVAGRKYDYSLHPYAGETFLFTWDGKDAYGRIVHGVQLANVAIEYVYEAVYYSRGAASGRRSFGQAPGQILGYAAIPARMEIKLPQRLTATIGSFASKGQGFGGWSLDVQHSYNPQAQTLYLGDGRRRSAKDISKVISTVAGNGGYGNSGDGGPASNAQMSSIGGLTFDDKGNLYIADSSNKQIRKVAPDGTITTRAWFAYFPQGIAIDPQGNLYVPSHNQILRITPDNYTGSPVAGTGERGDSGDGGPATSAMLCQPHDVAVDNQGNLYIADFCNYRIRKVGTDGIITTAAYLPWGHSPVAVSVDNVGNLYIASGSYYFGSFIRKVSPDGIMTTVAGIGAAGYNGDGIPAVTAKLYTPTDVAVDSLGNVYIADSENYRIRKVAPDGIITTVAGTGVARWGGPSGDGGPAINALIGDNMTGPLYLALDPQNDLFIGDFYRVRKVTTAMPGFTDQDFVVHSDDGRELYGFNAQGKHLKTTDAVTGIVLYTFTYGSAEYLTAVTDRNGNVTTIDRDAAGNPTAIIAPGGQRTTLSLDANGYLTGVANPAGETTALEHTAEGLLTTFTTPEGNVHTFTYDDQRNQ